MRNATARTMRKRKRAWMARRVSPTTRQQSTRRALPGDVLGRQAVAPAVEHRHNGRLRCLGLRDVAMEPLGLLSAAADDPPQHRPDDSAKTAHVLAGWGRRG